MEEEATFETGEQSPDDIVLDSYRNAHDQIQAEGRFQLEQEQIEQQQQKEQSNFLTEAGSAVVGGAADAIESAGSFLELSGDTIKTAVNTAFGRSIDESQNPFSQHYVHGDAAWLDIPDDWVPENHSALGKLTRGLIEFGVLTAATGGIGGATGATARVAGYGAKIYRGARAAGIGIKGSRALAFVPKGSIIAAEGSIADLVSHSSESENIANLVAEHAPFIPFAEALAVKPEDNPWYARIKTVAAGAGINLVGHGLVAYAKNSWKAAREVKAGKSIDEANLDANKAMEAELEDAIEFDDAASEVMALNNFAEGRGISNANFRDDYLRETLTKEEYARYVDPDTSLDDVAALDKIADARGAETGNAFDYETGKTPRQLELNFGRESDPFVNPKLYGNSERSTYRPDSPDPVRTNLRESIEDLKAGNEGRSYSPLVTESALRNMSRNDPALRTYIKQVADTLSKEVFRNPENTLDFKEVQALILRQADELYSRIESGGAQELERYFKENGDGIVWIHAGNQVTTGTASQKMALQLVINTLAKQIHAIEQGTRTLGNHVNTFRQAEQVYDAMKVAMKEHKKVGYMTGLELRYQKGDVLPPDVRRQINQGLEQIDNEQNAFFDELKKLAKNGDYSLRRDLSELYELSNGKVRTVADINTYLKSVLWGGRMDGQNLPARWRTEARSIFYNSILSSLKTPIKAVAGTNLIAMLRPFQAFVGASIRNGPEAKQQMLIATAQIDALGQAFAEGLKMFKHNWDLGINRQSQTYFGRFDFEKDIQEWKGLGDFYRKYGNNNEQQAYEVMDWIVDANNNPWMRYSQNAMGAGDALARTIIGRMEMRMRAAKSAIESGVDLDNVRAWADKYEETFRKEIFKKDQNGHWVLSDKAAKLAGDEATMTHALPGQLSHIEGLSKITGMRAFFPFIRTGFNSLGLAFQHTELVKFTNKYHDIMNGQNLAAYGIRPADLGSAQDLMRGRKAIGNTIIGGTFVAALAGNVTGSLPLAKEERDLWKLNGIQPNSFKIGNAWVSYDGVEPFNTLFAATANIANYQHALGEDLRDDMINKLTYMASAVLVDKSMLAGVKDLAEVLSPEGNQSKLERTAAKYFRSHLPYAGLLAQLGTVMNANDVEARGFWETIVRRDAIFKSSLEPKYDILSKDRSGKYAYTAPPGNPLLRLFNSLSPIAVTPVDADPVKMGLAEMSFNLPEMMSNYKGVKLNSYERSQLQKYMQMTDLRQRLERLMAPGGTWRKNLDAYKARGLRQSDGLELYKQRFYKLVQHEFTRAKQLAMQQLLYANPTLSENVQQRLRVQSAGGRGDYETIDYLLNEFPK